MDNYIFNHLALSSAIFRSLLCQNRLGSHLKKTFWGWIIITLLMWFISTLLSLLAWSHPDHRDHYSETFFKWLPLVLMGFPPSAFQQKKILLFPCFNGTCSCNQFCLWVFLWWKSAAPASSLPLLTSVYAGKGRVMRLENQVLQKMGLGKKK